jgi:predicted  nucleic acid-binding Zn-ribbon protein
LEERVEELESEVVKLRTEVDSESSRATDAGRSYVTKKEEFAELENKFKVVKEELAQIKNDSDTEVANLKVQLDVATRKVISQFALLSIYSIA